MAPDGYTGAIELIVGVNRAGSIAGVRAVQVSDGELLDLAGVERDDVIEKLNGVEVNDANAAQRMLRDLASCEPMSASVVGPKGERTIEITTEMLERVECAR